MKQELVERIEQELSGMARISQALERAREVLGDENAIEALTHLGYALEVMEERSARIADLWDEVMSYGVSGPEEETRVAIEGDLWTYCPECEMLVTCRWEGREQKLVVDGRRVRVVYAVPVCIRCGSECGGDELDRAIVEAARKSSKPVVFVGGGKYVVEMWKTTAREMAKRWNRVMEKLSRAKDQLPKELRYELEEDFIAWSVPVRWPFDEDENETG